jgi:hypothetical protein
MIRDFDIKAPFSLPEVATLAKRMKLDLSKEKFDLAALHQGMAVELEHKSLTGGDASDTATIALDHLREDPDYYDKLEIMENSAADGALDEVSSKEFSKLISKEVSDAMKEASTSKLIGELTRRSSLLDNSGLTDSADKLDQHILTATAGIIDSLREKIESYREKARRRYDSDIAPATAPVAVVKKLPPGLTVEMEGNMQITFKRNADLDQAIRQHKVTIDEVVAAVQKALTTAALSDSLDKLKAADFSTKYNKARELATLHGILQ